MKCAFEETPSSTLIRIEGAMSDDYLGEVRGVFESALARKLPIIVDIAEVSFISSSGLGLLFNTDSRLKTEGKKLVIASPSEEVRRLFVVTRIENHVLICNSVSDALSHIR
jgi:anti-sigma B factor antagonist